MYVGRGRLPPDGEKESERKYSSKENVTAKKEPEHLE